MSNRAKTSLEKAMDDLACARDEVKVGLHLLSMEAKEKCSGLESRLREIDENLRVCARRSRQLRASLEDTGCASHGREHPSQDAAIRTAPDEARPGMVIDGWQR